MSDYNKEEKDCYDTTRSYLKAILSKHPGKEAVMAAAFAVEVQDKTSTKAQKKVRKK